jgi:hypothetical protein
MKQMPCVTTRHQTELLNNSVRRATYSPRRAPLQPRWVTISWLFLLRRMMRLAMGWCGFRAAAAASVRLLRLPWTRRQRTTTREVHSSYTGSVHNDTRINGMRQSRRDEYNTSNSTTTALATTTVHTRHKQNNTNIIMCCATVHHITWHLHKLPHHQRNNPSTTN